MAHTKAVLATSTFICPHVSPSPSYTEGSWILQLWFAGAVKLNVPPVSQSGPCAYGLSALSVYQRTCGSLQMASLLVKLPAWTLPVPPPP